MGALIDIIAEGIKQFGGEIVGGILFAVALWMFPGLRKFFGRDKARNEDDTEAETRRQLEILQEEERQLAYLKEALKRHDEALKLTETQTVEESRRKSEIQRQLEEQRKEEERVKAEIQRKQEELRKAEEKRAEEARRKVELARQLEEKRREEERVKAEIQRRQGELRQAEARKAEEARQREEAQRQLESMRGSLEAQSSNNWWYNHYEEFIAVAVLFICGVCVFVDVRLFYSVEAQKELGDKYQSAGDYSQALYWYRKAADNGDAEIQRHLASIYYFGVGVSQDKAEAKKWWTQATEHYRQAAEREDVQAQFKLGEMYDFPFWNMDTDSFSKAANWYLKATEQGHIQAQYRLGALYYFNFKNNHEAVKWYRMAAEQGDARAQYHLGDMYENGYGVSKDIAEANKWHDKALEQGYQPLIIEFVD